VSFVVSFPFHHKVRKVVFTKSTEKNRARITRLNEFSQIELCAFVFFVISFFFSEKLPCFMKEILLIDDDLSLAKLLETYFQKFDFRLTHAAKPSEAMKRLSEHPFDAIILDVMLPEQDGFKVAQEIRSLTDTPIIMLTARGDVHDRIIGLEMGADDYLPKPFEPRELVARLHSLIRRSTPASMAHIYKSGALVLDEKTFSATLHNSPLELTSTEFELLLLFVKHEGKTLSREFIMQNTKGIQWESYDRTIDVMVSKLRAKLHDDAKNPKYLKTIWGRGYAFVGYYDK
jgi:two-component system phosphate regulon response regulator OmpR